MTLSPNQTLGYTSQGLLSRFNLYAGRPDGVLVDGESDAVSDPIKFIFLADAEQAIINRISSIKANILYGDPQPLSTSDGGYTYVFGYDDNGNLLFPLGRTQIFPTLNCLPGYALTPGVDYLDEGTRIRCCNNTPIPGPLYWYGLQDSTLMSRTNQPVLQPAQANLLTVAKAVADWAESDNVLNAALADRMKVKYETEFGFLMTAIRKHLRGSGNRTRLFAPWAAAFGPSLSTAYST